MGKRNRKQTIGICCLCGNYGPLSIEHVPPEKAFNAFTVIEYHWNGNRTLSRSKGKKIQNGVKAHTLCESCNNSTGSWYGDEYVKWVRTFARILAEVRRTKSGDGIARLSNVSPSRFIKQVATCFVSVLGQPGEAKFIETYPKLAEFILNKDSVCLPDNFRFFMNLFDYSLPSTSLRRYPVAAKMTVRLNDKTVEHVSSTGFSEIAHPPLQLIMMMDGKDYPESTEITHFAQHSFAERCDIELALRIVSSRNPMPGAD